MKQLDCVKCHAPIYDPKRDTCDRCSAETRAGIRALRAFLTLLTERQPGKRGESTG